MKKLIALIAASYLAITANAASGCTPGTITYTNSYIGYTDFITDIPIPQFNPCLGTLRSVTVQAQYIENRTASMENRGMGDQTFTVAITNTILVTVPNATDNRNTYTSPFAVTKALKSYDGVNDFGGLSGYTTNYITTNAVSIALTSITPFAGYSVIPVRVSASGAFTGRFPGGSYAWNGQDLIEVRIFVSYTYDPFIVFNYDNRKFKRIV
jgi:hypothetical protein